MYLLYSVSALLAIPIVRRPDVIWAASPSIFSSYPALIYHLLFRVPIVRNVDDLWPETALQQGIVKSRLGGISRAFARVAYCLAKSFTPISRGYIKTLRRTYNIAPQSIHVAEVGVDTNRFHPKSSANSSSRRFRVIYSGILGVGYDFRTVLAAAERIMDRGQIEFLIRGMGEMETFIRQYIEEKKLSNVTLSTEFLESDALVNLLQSADALLLPMASFESHDAGVPTKLMEYMACGRPVICVSKGISAEIVSKANCGYVVKPSCPEDLVDAIVQLRADPNLTMMGQRGREYAVQHYSLPIIAKKLERAFNYAREKCI
jgi:glycosyltransferase involved in cell wall biosynthesis